jgi:hypothetical protein
MDISADKNKSDANRPGFFSAVWQAIGSLVRRLIAFFVLTKADQLKAGIYMGGEGRDE